MGKGGYSGGSSTIRLVQEGTSWGSSDAAESQRGNGGKRRTGKPPAKKPKIDLGAEREARHRIGLIRAFISQCVTAHAADKLTASAPVAPKILRGSIGHAGGNIKWLEGNRDFQILFHEIYCQHRNEKIPFEKVWGPSRR
jgi:hypothetical protein